MKNSSIAAYILATLLLTSIGMFMYTSSQSTINDSFYQMSTQEIEAFNSQFTIYGGSQTGAKLKSLMGTLIANANTYKEVPKKIVSVNAEVTDGEETEAEYLSDEEDKEELQRYTDEIGEIRNKLEVKHSYEVSFDYSENGLLNQIRIDY